MQESVIFLGTSHGDPSLTRFCSSTLYTLGETRILVDAGEPASALLIRAGIHPAALDAVFLTHMHLDHANGLSSMYYQIIKYHDKKRVEMFFADPEAIAPFMQWNNAMRNLPIDDTRLVISAVSTDMVWEKNGIKVRPIPTEHMGKKGPSYAYEIITPESKIIHTGDLTADFRDFPVHEDDETVDLCVCEATHIRFNQDIFLEKLKRAPIKKLVLNHIGPGWTDGKEELLRELTAQLPYPSVIAFDGTSADING